METVDGKVMSTEEINLIRKYRQKQDFQLGFAAGINAAARRLQSLANECGGGAGTGSTADSLRFAATQVLKTQLPK